MNDFVFDLEQSVNMGKISENDFKESKSIGLIKELLEKNNKIKVRTTEEDKIPDLDGRVSILDKNNHDRLLIEVQSKTLPEEYNESTPYHYDCDTKVLNVVKYNKSFNPVVLFMSDIKNKKLYYKLISTEYLEKINFQNQDTKRIKFDDNDLYEEDKFIYEMIEYAKLKTIIIKKGSDSLITSYVNGPNKYYHIMQEEIDKLNYRFDHELKVIKDTLFPYVWKFGIAYNKTEDGFILGIYKIYKGTNDTLVKNFDIKNGNYMFAEFSKLNKSISIVLNKWIKQCVNDFYNVYWLHPQNCSNDVLSEIVFTFLDNITYLSDKIKDSNSSNYYKDEESVDVIHSYINGLTKFYNTIWNNKDKYKDAKILEPYYRACGKFLIFNPFINFHNSKDLLEKYLFEKDLSPFKSNVFSNTNLNMDLIMLSVIELEKRKIKKVKRLHSKEDISIMQKVFSNLCQSYLYTKNKLNLDNKQVISGQYTIYYFNDFDGTYCVCYSKSDKLEINFINEITDNYSEILGKAVQTGKLKDFFRISMPLYNITRLLINKGCMEAQGEKFEFKSESLNIFGLKDFPILTMNK